MRCRLNLGWAAKTRRRIKRSDSVLRKIEASECCDIWCRFGEIYFYPFIDDRSSHKTKATSMEYGNDWTFKWMCFMVSNTFPSNASQDDYLNIKSITLMIIPAAATLLDTEFFVLRPTRMSWDSSVMTPRCATHQVKPPAKQPLPQPDRNKKKMKIILMDENV